MERDRFSMEPLFPCTVRACAQYWLWYAVVTSYTDSRRQRSGSVEHHDEILRCLEAASGPVEHTFFLSEQNHLPLGADLMQDVQNGTLSQRVAVRGDII